MQQSKSLVLSCYIGGIKPDPQRGTTVCLDSGIYIGPWRESVIKHGLDALVVTNCSEGFAVNYETQRLRFELLPRLEYGAEFSINDERFYYFARILGRLADPMRVMITDISDVEFNRDPFQSMAGESLYVSSNDTWADKPVVYKERLVPLVGEQEAAAMRKLPIYCPGAWGGPRDKVLAVVARTLKTIEYGVRRGLYNCNLAAFNYALRQIQPDIITGHPHFSQFKKYERDGLAAVRHK
jgi:hypothetical protein